MICHRWLSSPILSLMVLELIENDYRTLRAIAIHILITRVNPIFPWFTRITRENGITMTALFNVWLETHYKANRYANECSDFMKSFSLANTIYSWRDYVNVTHSHYLFIVLPFMFDLRLRGQLLCLRIFFLWKALLVTGKQLVSNVTSYTIPLLW